MFHRFRPVDASWISKNRILILLSYDWFEKEQLPSLYFNSEKSLILNLERAPLYCFGELTGYFREGANITFMCATESIEIDKNIFIAGSFNGWGNAIGQEEWRLKLEKIAEKQYLMLTIPWDKCYSADTSLLFKFVTEDNVWLQVPVDAPNYEVDSHNNSNYKIHPHATGHNVFIFDPDIDYDPAVQNKIFWKDDRGAHTLLIDDSALFFKLGSERPLGAIVEENKTIFRIFAPRAKSVKVAFYSNLSEEGSKTLDLNRNSDYTWEIEHFDDLQGVYYHYTILGDNSSIKNNFNESFKILDPYALATVGPGGPGIVINKKSIKIMRKSFKVPTWNDLIILEAHLRDLVENTLFGAGFQIPIGFRNLAQWLGTKDNYLKELGINAVELLPIQEFESILPSEYHWGYMTTNYFCPSSCYTLGKNPTSQIEEFQSVVNAFHEANIAVILDVVYNHLGSPNPLLHIDKNYYFELTKEGNLSNWSGCGNDFRANTPMGKRLIIDSLIYLIETFDIDGFRFDLAELLGVEVLKEIEIVLKAVKPSIILIAEPWSFRGHIGHALKSTGYTSWNDDYREFIANYVLGRSNKEAFQYFIAGSTSYLARFTAQSINYSASHDDYCWIDKITENRDHDGLNPTLHDVRRTHLMVAILMMSVGIPMIAEGQDILHSKRGYFNTYQRGDLNALDYNNIANYSGTHEYFSKWIRFRLSENGRALRISNRPSIGYFKFYYDEDSSAIGVLYNANYSLEGAAQLFFVVNQQLGVSTLNVQDIDFEHFLQIADHERIEPEGLDGGFITWQNGVLIIPPLGCGLWKKRI